MSAQLKTGKRVDVRKLCSMGLLCALSIVLVYAVRMPLFPAAPFLEYDPADIPILIGTMIYGPLAGLALTVAVSFLQAVTVSSSSGVIGFVMHVAATGAMVLVVGNLYRIGNPGRIRAAFSLAAGALSMTLVMVGMNLVLTPIFMNTPVEAVKAMLIPVLIPFNLLKAGINCVFTFLVYKVVEKAALPKSMMPSHQKA